MRTARTGAPPRRLSSDVIFELFLRQLKADEQFKAGALHSGADFGDAQRVNGGVFLGLNGVVIKSHGGTDAEGFAAAIDVGYDMVRNGLKAKIENDLQKYHAGRPVEGAAQAMNDEE